MLSALVALCVVWELHMTGISMTDDTGAGSEAQTTVAAAEESPTEAAAPAAEVTTEAGGTTTTADTANASAGLETADVWEATLPDSSTLSGVWSEDIVKVAASQMGYRESADGSSRYGIWYGSPYDDWNAMFVSFCLNYTGVPESTFPRGKDAGTWVAALTEKGLCSTMDKASPKAGDIAFLDTDGDGTADAAGIISSVTANESGVFTQCTLTEGDVDGAVSSVTVTAASGTITGIAVLPENAETTTAKAETAAVAAAEAPTTAAAAEAPTEAAAAQNDDYGIMLMSEGDALAAGTYGNYKFSYNTLKNAFTQDNTYSSYYNSDSPLGVAGSFHLVGFGTVTLTSHCNGNILAGTLDASTSNFGTNNLANELSYAVNYTKVNGVSASSTDHILVVGSGNTVGTADNNNGLTVSGTKLDKPHNLVQDQDSSTAPFISLSEVETEVRSLSTRMSEVTDSGITKNTSESNNMSLTLTDAGGANYITMTPAEVNALGGNAYDLKMLGFQSKKAGSIIINIDCTGQSGKTVTLPNATVYIDGEAQATSETTDFSAGKVIWNFTNADGVTVDANKMTGIIIAPGATVNLNSNLNGSVIAENINVKAESHRTDFTGTTGLTGTGTTSYTLPEAGGSGVVWIAVLGAGLMLAAGALLISMQKKRVKNANTVSAETIEEREKK